MKWNINESRKSIIKHINKKTLPFCAAILLVVNAFAQAPNKMSYQAVIRNNSNALVINSTIGMRIQIIQGSIFGAAVYVETQNPTTNSNGMVSIEIGNGVVVSGNFSIINWANGPYFIKTETDPTGGSSYSITGTSQLLSVPYALHAKTADSIVGGRGITISSISSAGDSLHLSNGQTFVAGGRGITISSVSSTGDSLYLSNGQYFVTGSSSVGIGKLVMPTISTNTVTNITSNSAKFGGIISDANGNQIMERGIVFSKSSNPTLGSSRIVIGNGIGAFDTTTSMSFSYQHFLQPNTQYFVRAYALTENNITVYGNELSFTTIGLTPPTITTNPVTGITSNSATFGGLISNTNGNQILERGIVYSKMPNPTLSSNKIVIGNGIGSFDTTTSMSYNYQHFLQPNTQYFVRAYALTENNNIVYGNELSFTTLTLTPPTITTNAVTGITSNSATFGGLISNTNGNQILQRGIVYSTSQTPTIDNSALFYIGSGAGGFDTISPLIYGRLLNANTTYYIRSFAYNENNTYAYGNEVSFTTLPVGQTGPGGGIVFFNKGNASGGWQYLETATSDQSTGIQWGCQGTAIPGTQLIVGSGEANTSLITAGCNHPSFAAKLCDNLSLGGQTDWFLPSADELTLMYKNLHVNNQGNFNTSAAYWSSSGFGLNGAWFTYFNNNNGGNIIGTTKDNTFFVRAVRSF